MMIDSDSLNEWWDDLTIEQRRAAFTLWQASDVKTIYATDNTTHDNLEGIRMNIRFSFDEHRFPRPYIAWDEDRFWNK